MKYVEEYRDPQAARRLIDAVRRRATRRWTIMEVCGGQTHGLLRYGIDVELADCVDFIHGPGCPVCVTPASAVDRAQALALRDGVVLTTFGDMLRVPGSSRTLLDVRAVGGDVRAVYTPLDAVALARRMPERHVVFFAVGFETTAPATALAVRQAAALELDNFSLLSAHVRVQPAMEAIMKADDCRVEAFLAAGHVCTITGYESYDDFADRYRVPVVVAGFEPIDLLQAVAACVEQLEAGRREAQNCYGRSVRREGNRAACDVVRDVFEICDQPWRAIGTVPDGGLQLRDEWKRFDAERRFGVRELPIVERGRCRSGDVLTGRIKPPQCPEFGRGCTPDAPLGAPMVSSEGACAAYYRYGRATAAKSSSQQAEVAS